MIKVIFIDWNKTLSHDLFWGHLQQSSHPHHKHLAPIEKWLFEDNRDKIHLWMRGGINMHDITSGMSQDIGVKQDLILKELKHSCEIMKLASDEIVNLVGDIQDQGVKVVIATDNMDTFTSYTVPAMRLDSIFDDILNSYEVGCLKDDELPCDSISFFDQYLAQNGWSYSDAVLLDDSPDKSHKYARLGFRRIVIDNNNPVELVLRRLADEK